MSHNRQLDIADLSILFAWVVAEVQQRRTAYSALREGNEMRPGTQTGALQRGVPALHLGGDSSAALLQRFHCIRIPFRFESSSLPLLSSTPFPVSVKNPLIIPTEYTRRDAYD